MSELGYSPGAVINYFLKKSKSDSISITPMKLQKLLYFAHGWHLAFYGKPLINEPLEAWDFGPVCSSVYHEYKEYGKRSIPPEAEMREMFNPDISEYIDKSDKNTLTLLDSVWNAYGKYDGLVLSQWTHVEKENNPWLKTRNTQGAKRFAQIDDKDIQTYFSSLLQKQKLF